MITVCLQNIKGGVAKTQVSISLASAHAMYFKELGLNEKPRILLVDADPQSNVKSYYRMKLPEKDFSDFLISGTDFRDCIKTVDIEGQPAFDVMLSSRKLSEADIKLAGFPRREDTLLFRFEEQNLASHYDVILFDCPPTLNLTTFNILRACEFLLIPTTPDHLSLSGVQTILENCNIVEKYFKHKPDLLGIVPTIYDGRLKIHQQFLETIKKSLAHTKIYKPIRTDVKIPNAAVRKKSIFEYAPKCRASEDLKQLYLDVFTEVSKRKSKAPTLESPPERTPEVSI